MAITANAQNFPAMLRSAPAYDTDAVSQVAPVKNQTVPNRSVQEPTASGIHLSDGHATRSQMIALLDRLQLSMVVTTYLTGTGGCVFCLKDDCARQFLPNADTLELGRRLRGDTSATPLDLEREIVVAMLGAPQALVFPTFAELKSAIRVRLGIVRSAASSRLAFGTSTAERPADYWTYQDDVGYTIIPGRSLIAGLEKATQPASANDPCYAFSCYRATEYVILHAIAQELELVNPDLLQQLQHLWEVRPIKSGEYHDVFLDEFGSFEQPIPEKFYIPGDRVWFRNPDPISANVSGYEGSWVIYLGDGLFSNFWKNDRPYTLEDKCLEIYHWRNAMYFDGDGEPRVNDAVVDRLVAMTKASPELLTHILRVMEKPRDPRNVFAEGGCIDVSREFPKSLCIQTARIAVPESRVNLCKEGA